MKFVFPFILGIILGWKFQIPIYPTFLSLVLFICLFIIFSLTEKLRYLLAAVVFMILMLFGVLKITYDSKYFSDDSVSNYIMPGKTIFLKASVTDLPRISDQSVRFAVEAESINYNGKCCRVSGGVLVSILKNKIDSSILKYLTYGRRILLEGELATIRTARNPGEFDLKNYLNLNNIYARYYPNKMDSTNILSSTKQNILSSLVYPVRRSVAENIDRYIGGEEAKFLKGLVIGERSEIPVEIKTAFINSGVMHILAVSGLHVAIVTFILLVILQVLRIPEKLRIIITCLLLVYYIFLTGSAPSVTRSVIMAIVFLGGKLLERKNDIYNALAFSAIILLLIDAKQFLQPGFQLSFTAVFSIVYLYPKINKVRELISEKFRDNKIVVLIFALFSVSIAAGIGTLPFTSLYFGKISLISFVANLVIVPLSNLILALGMLMVAISYISSWLASIYAEVTSFVTWLLLKLVAFFGNLPFAYIDARFSFFATLMFYAVIGVVVNVGKSEIMKNDGKTMLVDGGPKTFASDAGARFIIPFLKYKHVDRINSLLISHPDADHLGGVPTIMRQLKIDQVIDTKFECRSALCQDYHHIIDSIGLPRLHSYAQSLIDQSNHYRLYILNPPKTLLTDYVNKSYNVNNQSIVLKLVYGKTSLLLTGDAEDEAETFIIKRFGNFIRSDVLKVAHHGSSSGTSETYLQLIKPEKAVISVGAKNKFNHPSGEVIQRIKDVGCELFRTDESGAVVMETDGETWSVVDWR
ncbi:MAG: ComEC/Rec2 family competence protein [Ignavibacteriales bacterium]|nr:ComEC/Rec2 family competence protein [Ignavibacteriales bacterium]